MIKSYNVGRLHYDDKKYYEAGVEYGKILKIIVGNSTNNQTSDNNSDSDVLVRNIDNDDQIYKSIDFPKYLLIIWSTYLDKAGLDNLDDQCILSKKLLLKELTAKLDTLEYKSVSKHLDEIRISLILVISKCVNDTSE